MPLDESSGYLVVDTNYCLGRSLHVEIEKIDDDGIHHVLLFASESQSESMVCKIYYNPVWFLF